MSDEKILPVLSCEVEGARALDWLFKHRTADEIRYKLEELGYTVREE